MKRIFIKDGAEVVAERWARGTSIDGVTRYCQQFCLNTGRGILRVNTGDWVLKGPGKMKAVLTDEQFTACFGVEDGNN